MFTRTSLITVSVAVATCLWTAAPAGAGSLVGGLGNTVGGLTKSVTQSAGTNSSNSSKSAGASVSASLGNGSVKAGASASVGNTSAGVSANLGSGGGRSLSAGLSTGTGGVKTGTGGTGILNVLFGSARVKTRIDINTPMASNNPDTGDGTEAANGDGDTILKGKSQSLKPGRRFTEDVLPFSCGTVAKHPENFDAKVLRTCIRQMAAN